MTATGTALDMLMLTRILKAASLALALVAPAVGQSQRVWLDVYDPPPGTATARASHVVPFPGGGVVSASVGEQGTAEAVIRRLSENGDVLWEVQRALPVQDYIGLTGIEYVAGLDVGRGGSVAVAFGGAGPMEIRMYEPDGTLRWQKDVPVAVGPHFERSTIRVATGGDVVFASNEVLYQNGLFNPRLALHRLAGADGQTLWSAPASPTDRDVKMETDFQGNTLLAVNRDSTGAAVWSLERYDPSGVVTGAITFGTAGNPGGILDLEVDVTGRVVVMIGGLFAGSVVSVDASLSMEWETLIPPIYSGSLALMADGDVVLFNAGLNWDLVRFDRVTGAARYAAANVVGRSLFAHAVGLPNGNSVVALGKLDLADGLCLQERDPMGNVLRTHVPAATSAFNVNDLVLGARGNVYAAYGLGGQFTSTRGAVAKIVFESEQGAPYCGPAVPNSTGQSATVRAVGSLQTATNNLSLIFADLPPGTTVLPIASQTMGLVVQPGGSQGVLCLSGSVGRFDEPGEVRTADAQGQASMQVELLRMPTPGGLVPAMSGETWNFQAWFRDSVPSQASTSNFTDAVSITFR